MKTVMSPKFSNLLTELRKNHSTQCSLLHMVKSWRNTLDPSSGDEEFQEMGGKVEIGRSSRNGRLIHSTLY